MTVCSRISTFSRVGNHESGIEKLRRDLDDGSWKQRNHEILEKTQLDLGYRLVIGDGRFLALRSGRL